jgi:rRNA maturation RNase YbeY
MTKFPDLDSESPSSKLAIYNPAEYPLPFDPDIAIQLLENIESGESVAFKYVEVVFTDEEGIVDINQTYLNRDYVTDIISFRLDDDESNHEIEGTLYCCAPRISEQSDEFDTTPESEFLRIIAHGLLHLTGYNDSTDEERRSMTSLEDRYLQSLNP